MTARSENKANCLAENADARAPLSSYLQGDNQTAPREGWTIFSSDDDSEPTRAPNLSVLKQIKNFLNAKSEDTIVRFDSNTQKFRVDYPYYDSDSDVERTEPRQSGDGVSFPSPSAETSDETELDFNEQEEKEPPCEENASFPLDACKKVVETSPPQLDMNESIPIEPLGEEPKRTDFEYSCEILAAPQESGYETKEEDASIQGDDSLDIVDYPELKPSANQESYLLDVAQILNSDFSRSREPAVHGGIKKENKPFATSEENPSAVSASSHGLESVASTSKRRDLNNFVIGDVSQHKACRRQDPNKRLPIFRRFVDLATKRQQINAVDAEEIPVKRVETPTQDYSREICICDAYESANTIEVVVAPCYVGANVTFQNQ